MHTSNLNIVIVRINNRYGINFKFKCNTEKFEECLLKCRKITDLEKNQGSALIYRRWRLQRPYDFHILLQVILILNVMRNRECSLYLHVLRLALRKFAYLIFVSLLERK